MSIELGTNVMDLLCGFSIFPCLVTPPHTAQIVKTIQNIDSLEFFYVQKPLSIKAPILFIFNSVFHIIEDKTNN